MAAKALIDEVLQHLVSLVLSALCLLHVRVRLVGDFKVSVSSLLENSAFPRYKVVLLANSMEIGLLGFDKANVPESKS